MNGEDRIQKRLEIRTVLCSVYSKDPSCLEGKFILIKEAEGNLMTENLCRAKLPAFEFWICHLVTLNLG